MIFNMTGGMPLNFTVKAYASELLLPATAAENTIAVITDTPIAGWSFAVKAPEAPSAGVVWFPSSTVSETPFNALKKNEIMLYPTSTQQYIDGEWQSKKAKIFQNGAWIDLLKYIYNEGNTYEDVTGGWATKGVTYNNGSGTPRALDISYGDSEIGFTQTYLSESDYESGIAYTVKKIDLTPYRYIIFTSKRAVESSRNANFWLWTSIGTDQHQNFLLAQEVTHSTVYESQTVDVTNINQAAHIGIGLIAPQTIYVKSIQLVSK